MSAKATLAALLFALSLAPAHVVDVGDSAPDFSATTLDGKEISLSDFKGQVLLINFWATWCAPCKEELPLLEAYYRLQGKYGLRVLAVSTEGSLPVERLRPLAEHLTLSMVRDFRGPYRAIRGDVPSNFVIGRDGIVHYARPGAFDLDSLNRILVPLLQAPAPPAPIVPEKL